MILNVSYFSEATMSEAELNTYKLQLQQVEAALTTDPDNEVRVPLTSEDMVYNAPIVSRSC